MTAAGHVVVGDEVGLGVPWCGVLGGEDQELVGCVERVGVPPGGHADAVASLEYLEG